MRIIVKENLHWDSKIRQSTKFGLRGVPAVDFLMRGDFGCRWSSIGTAGPKRAFRASFHEFRLSYLGLNNSDTNIRWSFSRTRDSPNKMRASARIALVALLAVVLFLAPPLTTDAAEGRRGPGRAVQGRKRPGQKATNADKLPMWVDRVVYPSSVDVPDVLKGLTSKDVKCGEGAQGEVSKFSHPDGFQAVVKFAFGTDAGLKVVGDEFATYQEVYNTAGTSQVPGLAEVFGTAYFNDPLKQAKRVLTLVMKGPYVLR